MVDADLSWAAQEFATLQGGDPRRRARATTLLDSLAQHPGAPCGEACRTAAASEAAYRFCSNGCVEPDALYAAHRDATLTRVAAEPVVLAVNATTLRDDSSHPGTLDVGPLRSARQQGLLVHGTLAVTPDGVPLGLLRAEVWTRDAESYGQLPDRHRRTLAEKESHVWLDSLTAACQARRTCPQTQVIAVGDREADSYALFVAARPVGVDLLVRARHDRALADGGRRRARVAAGPVVAETTVALRARPGVAARTAHLPLRCCAVTLLPPARRAAEHLPAVALWVVWAHEPHPPRDVAPLDWLLLTTVPTADGTAALVRLGWYRRRWLIALWHKVLKSGCAIEERQVQTAARVQRLLALDAIVAWRILWATFLARAAPDLCCTVLLSDAEWQALWCRIYNRPDPPPEPPTLRQAVRWIAELGGFLGRKHDGEPGMETLWRGFQHLTEATIMYTVFRPAKHSTAAQAL